MTAQDASWPIMRRALVAILRGITHAEIEPVLGALIEEGFEAIEIPLNSPDPFRSIEAAVRMVPKNILVGAGTVLDREEVEQLRNAGGRLVVSPNVDADVIRHTRDLGMISLPGVFTATEALTALHAGASALKFFPADVLGPGGIQAISVVLPAGTPLFAVGGVSEAEFAPYARAGIHHFGLGSTIYRPGLSVSTVQARARAVIAAYDSIYGKGKELPRAII